MPMAQGGREWKWRKGRRGGTESRGGRSGDTEDEREVREIKSQVRCPGPGVVHAEGTSSPGLLEGTLLSPELSLDLWPPEPEGNSLLSLWVLWSRVFVPMGKLGTGWTCLFPGPEFDLGPTLFPAVLQSVISHL